MEAATENKIGKVYKWVGDSYALVMDFRGATKERENRTEVMVTRPGQDGQLVFSNAAAIFFLSDTDLAEEKRCNCQKIGKYTYKLLDGKPKRRGRPAQFSLKIYGALDGTERMVQNNSYAQTCIQLCGGEETPEGSFFISPGTGKCRRTGIAEQVGRMYIEDIDTDENLLELVRMCIEDYNNGTSVKEIEKKLRGIRLAIKAERV